MIVLATVHSAAFAQAPAAAPKPAQIDRNGVIILVRSALLALDQANKTGNYTVLRDLGAPAFPGQHGGAARRDLRRAAPRQSRSLRRRGDRSAAHAAAADRGQRHDADGGLLPLGADAGQFRAALRAGERALAAVRHFGQSRLSPRRPRRPRRPLQPARPKTEFRPRRQRAHEVTPTGAQPARRNPQKSSSRRQGRRCCTLVN